MDHAEPGSVLLGAALDFPWKDSGYERFTYDWLSQLPVDRRKLLLTDPVGVVTTVIAESGAYTGYLLLSAAQEPALAYGSDLPADIQGRVADALAQSPAFTLVYASPTAKVFRLDFRTIPPEVMP